jgi:hypothetical protein
MCLNCNVMETKNIGLISHDDDYTYDSSLEEDESVDDDAITQSGGLIENFDKTDQDILTHELKNDDSESIQCEDEEEEEEEESEGLHKFSFGKFSFLVSSTSQNFSI